MKKYGFTLAEALITLAIIGIVAALTIPSVISNYQQQEFKTGLKKAVSVLNEAIQVNIAQEGETPYENENLLGYLQRHMSVIKTQALNTCYDNDGNAVTGLEGVDGCPVDGVYKSQNRNEAFYTTDGMRFEIPRYGDKAINLKLHETDNTIGFRGWNVCPYVNSSAIKMCKCGSYGLLNNPNKTIFTPCVVAVDVNGDKKPNPPMSFTRGNQPFAYTYPSPTDKKLQDVFTIMITDEKAIPFGVVAQRAMYSK